MTVYIVMIKSRQADHYVGAVYDNREAADREVERLQAAQGKIEVNDVWWESREVGP